ncbi:hypothetical protein [uncultured Sphaerochaeta sp.]|uniref:hypothetical protein n=1 Tax=uncultured Sphaerochaeta sp. TaxID=886478 RepID=UPI002A0A18B0|nr:hypothetical protein [uncultured Sphaerochaeta sp.]
MDRVRRFARTRFEDRELFIKSMNNFIDEMNDRELLLNESVEGRKLHCQIDKIYESSEMKIKLLKYLQGRGKGKRRDDIAEHFNITKHSVDKRIQELQSRDNYILGTKIQINPERATNIYDSTVHPLFLALNLSEVYGMLTSLIQAEMSVPGGTVTDIIKDVVSQLTDYAEGILKDSGLNIDAYHTDVSRAFRNESPKNKYYHAMKTGSVCMLRLYKSEDSLVGTLKPNMNPGNDFFFYPKGGGAPIPLACDDIKELIEIEES